MAAALRSRSSRRPGAWVRASGGLVPLVALAVLAPLAPLAQSKVFEAQVESFSNWVYVDKFVFDDSGGGKLQWEIQMSHPVAEQDEEVVPQSTQTSCNCAFVQYNGSEIQGGCDMIAEGVVRSNAGAADCKVNNLNISCDDWDKFYYLGLDCTTQRKYANKLLFYNDVSESISNWKDVYRALMTCDEKQQIASTALDLDPLVVNAGEVPVSRALKPRFWYVVLANCDASPKFDPISQANRGTLAINAKVKLTFLNKGWEDNDPPSFHFSADEIGYWELCIFLVSMYSVGFVAILAVIGIYHKNNLLHEIHLLLIASFFCYFLAMILYLVHYSQYMKDGVGKEACEIFARCFEVVGYLIFINTLLLVARGWTITTSKLSRKSENTFFTALLVCIYVGLFFSDTLRDRADSNYLYDSWAGYFFIAMNVFLMLTFHYLLHRTYVFEKLVVKRTFYRRFGLIYTIWFIQMPILVLIARTIPTYMQAKTLFGTERCIQLLAFMMIPMMQKPKNSYEVYAASDRLYDARIPSINRQLRVQPMAIELPRAQQAGGLPGLPPVNRRMTTNLEEANQLATSHLQQPPPPQQGAGVGTRGGANGEGIIES